jgi:hypothetical protein
MSFTTREVVCKIYNINITMTRSWNQSLQRKDEVGITIGEVPWDTPYSLNLSFNQTTGILNAASPKVRELTQCWVT